MSSMALELDAWSIRTAPAGKFLWDEESQQALVFPDTMLLESAKGKRLGAFVYFDVIVHFVVSDECLSQFPKARRIRLNEPRAEFRSKDQRITKVVWFPLEEGWKFNVTFQTRPEDADAVNAALRADSALLGPRIGGVTEEFSRNVREAFIELSARDLETISDCDVLSKQLSKFADIVSMKVSREAGARLLDQFVLQKVRALDAKSPRFELHDNTPSTLELLVRQQVNEVIAINASDLVVKEGA